MARLGGTKQCPATEEKGKNGSGHKNEDGWMGKSLAKHGKKRMVTISHEPVCDERKDQQPNLFHGSWFNSDTKKQPQDEPAGCFEQMKNFRLDI
jgi:hypothetical protein